MYSKGWLAGKGVRTFNQLESGPAALRANANLAAAQAAGTAERTVAADFAGSRGAALHVDAAEEAAASLAPACLRRRMPQRTGAGGRGGLLQRSTAGRCISRRLTGRQRRAEAAHGDAQAGRLAQRGARRQAAAAAVGKLRCCDSRGWGGHGDAAAEGCLRQL